MSKSYGFSKHLAGVTVDDATARVTEALKVEGFGVLTEIDVSATLKKKLDVDFRPYRILGACSPGLAYQALQVDPAIGLILPCNVVVQEADGGAEVLIIDPRAMFAAVDRPELEPVVAQADERLRRVVDAL
ncbi:MAG TPA: DUF302 domain-containing protein [Kofleriaceae bacterium]|nr:DUF302 domain-containing protein [Kofleriaceae bacterium]